MCYVFRSWHIYDVHFIFFLVLRMLCYSRVLFKACRSRMDGLVSAPSLKRLLLETRAASFCLFFLESVETDNFERFGNDMGDLVLVS